MIFEVRGGLGDEVAATAIVREYKRAHPDEIVQVFQPSRPDVWLHSPHLDWGKHDGAAPGLRAGRFTLRMDTGPNLPHGPVAHRHAAQLGMQIVDDTPELWLTPEERAVDFISRPERTIALDIGTGWESKRWSYGGWQRVVSALRADGWSVVGIGAGGISVPTSESPIEVTKTFYGQTDVRELAVLLGQCALFLGHDSGPMHVAAAVGTPQVVVFGVTKFFNYGYWNTTPVYPYSECGEKCYRGCYRLPKTGGKFNHCLDEVSVERVVDAVRVAARRFEYRPVDVRPETRTAVPRRGWKPKVIRAPEPELVPRP